MQQIKSNEYVNIDGDRFDVLKFVLAIFIIGIHTDVSYALMPIFRLAVPLFFIMTSYFFFHKQNILSSEQEKRTALKKYCLRILKLYLFWFILLLPIIIYHKKWYAGVSIYFPVRLLQSFLFGSTFKASWFLAASLINIAAVWYLSRKLSNGVLLILGFILYAFCCMTSSYCHLTERIPYFADFYDGYTSIFGGPYNSFPVATLFVVFGKYLADHQIYISNKSLCWITVLSFFLLYLEFYFVWKNRFILCNDSLFALIPLSLGIFMLIGQNHVKIQTRTSNLRKYSTIIFCAHASIAYVVLRLINHYFPDFQLFSYEDAEYILNFFITLAICLALCKFLLWLEKHEHFKWVKYSH